MNITSARVNLYINVYIQCEYYSYITSILDNLEAPFNPYSHLYVKAGPSFRVPDKTASSHLMNELPLFQRVYVQELGGPYCYGVHGTGVSLFEVPMYPQQRGGSGFY